MPARRTILHVIGGFVVACALVGLGACHAQQPATNGAPTAAFTTAFTAVDVVVGTGATARAGRCVYAHYTGALPDGTIVEASRDSTGAGNPVVPVSFPLGVGRVIAGWDRGFIGMRVGGTRRLVIPASLAYGAAGRPPAIPAHTALHFDVELLHVTDTIARDRRAPRGPGTYPACPAWSSVPPRR